MRLFFEDQSAKKIERRSGAETTMNSDHQRHKDKQALVRRQIRREVVPCERLVEFVKAFGEPNDHFRLTKIFKHQWQWVNAKHIGDEPYVEQWKCSTAPLQTFRRLLPSAAITKAKKRAREVLLTLLLVGRRVGWSRAPREIWQRLLAEVNEEECDL